MPHGQETGGVLGGSAEEAEHLLGAMQQLYDLRDYAGVMNLQREIHKCLRLFASPETCVEIASLLATAMTASGAHTLAIAYFRWAYRRHNDVDLPVGANAARRLAELRMARVCAGLGRAYAAVGEFADAESCIATCITLRYDLDGTPANMMPYLLMQAENWHALHKHEQAIQVLLPIMAHGRTVAATGDFANRLAEKSGICPIRLLGRCYTAIGEYDKALTCFASASLLASERGHAVSMVACRLEYAATKWAQIRCGKRWLERTAHALYYNKDFIGPPLLLAMVQRQVVQLVAAACTEAHGMAGVASFRIFMNGNGLPTAVRQVLLGAFEEPRCVLPLKVAWCAVESSQLNDTGSPLSLVLSFESTVRAQSAIHVVEHTFHCAVGVELPSLTTFLSEFLSRTLNCSDPAHTEEDIRLALLTLDSATELAFKHRLVALHRDCVILRLCLQFEQGIGGADTIDTFKQVLRAQVDAAKMPNPKCFTCNQDCTGVTVCGGCKVVRFCDTPHQKHASNRPFFSTTVRHTLLCPLLSLCRSLRKCQAKPNGGGAEAVLLAEQYDEALLQFLSTDHFIKHLDHENNTPGTHTHSL